MQPTDYSPDYLEAWADARAAYQSPPYAVPPLPLDEGKAASTEYQKGWRAARVWYQNTGGIIHDAPMYHPEILGITINAIHVPMGLRAPKSVEESTAKEKVVIRSL